MTVNRLCGSGLQAIVSAAQYILLGETDTAVAGGAESMSRAMYGSLSQRWGARMGDAKMMDMMVGALTDPFDTCTWASPPRTSRRKCSFTRARAGRVRRGKPSPRVEGRGGGTLQGTDTTTAGVGG